jgi:hypothetical protein
MTVDDEKEKTGVEDNNQAIPDDFVINFKIYSG